MGGSDIPYLRLTTTLDFCRQRILYPSIMEPIQATKSETTPITEDWLKEQGFHEMVSFNKQINDRLSVLLFRDSATTWYLSLREDNNGKSYNDDIVILRRNLKYQSEVEYFIKFLTKEH